MEEKKQIRITFTAFIMIIISVILITAAITSVIILGSQAQKENELIASNETTNRIDRNESKNHVDNGAVYVPPVYNEVVRENSNYVSNVISNTIVNEEEPTYAPEKEPYVDPSVNAPNIDNIEEFVLYYYDAVTYASHDFIVDWNDPTDKITNYDEVMKNLFTENGIKIYETEQPLLYFEDGVACFDAGDDHYDETLVDLQVKDIKKEENKITATVIKTRAIAPMVYTDETWDKENWERKDYETEFVMIKENGKWLVDYFEWHDYLYE